MPMTLVACAILSEFAAASARIPAFKDQALRQAGYAQSLLSRILSEPAFRRSVAATRRPYDQSHPGWAKEISWILSNLEGRFSRETRESIHDICSSLLRETNEAPDRRIVTRELVQNPAPWFLATVARELSELEPPTHDRPTRPGK